MKDKPLSYPRISDLPIEEQAQFERFLNGRPRPLLEFMDEYFPWDYENWKRKPQNRYWD